MSTLLGLEMKKYTTADYPSLFLVADVLDAAGYDTDGWVGTGMDLFQAEAFRAAIATGNETPFTVSQVSSHKVGTLEEVAERFGLEVKVLRSVRNGLRIPANSKTALTDLDKAHYAALILMGCTANAQPTSLIVMANAWAASHDGAVPGFDRIAKLSKLSEAMKAAPTSLKVFLNDAASFLGAYNDEQTYEMLELWGHDKEKLTLAVRMGNDGLDLAETKRFLTTMPLDTVKSLFPDEA